MAINVTRAVGICTLNRRHLTRLENEVMHRKARLGLRANVICLVAILTSFVTGSLAHAQTSVGLPQSVASGQTVTPLAPTGTIFTRLNPHLKDFPAYTVGQVIKLALSPDGRTLLALTSGYNILYDAAGVKDADASNEYVFIYDVTRNRLRQEQVLQVPNTFFGLAFSPGGSQFYVSGGVDDDVHVFASANGTWAESGRPIALGHNHGVGEIGQNGRPTVATLAVSANGKFLVAADLYNDAISIVDLHGRTKVGELDLRPGIINAAQSGIAGG
jgi:WD40 repeat protein